MCVVLFTAYVKKQFLRGNGLAFRQKYDINEYVGQTFGRLEIKEEVFVVKEGATKRTRYFLCKCSCGNEKLVAPYELISRQGTQSCGCLQSEMTSKSKRKTQEQFILDSESRYPSRFKYDKVVYTTNKTDVTIECVLHGDFTVTPNNHLHGSGGCPMCKNRIIGEKNRKDIGFFLDRAREAHGDKYDYSKSEYTLGTVPTTIICEKHGEFLVTPSEHMRGSGCPLCSRENTLVKEEEFLQRVYEAHGDKYGISDLGFTSLSEVVTPLCSEHGKFPIIAGNFANGAGCKRCSQEELGYTSENFIAKARLKYGDEYIYENTVYKGCRESVTVTCQKHGDFERPAFVFLQGVGCRQCKSENSASGFRSDKPASLYVLELEGNSVGTVTGYGISSNMEKRIGQHERNLSRHAIKITKECYFDFEYGYQALNIETQLRRILQPSSKLSGVEGFKKESCDIPFKDVISTVDDLLKTKDDFIYDTRFK